MACSAILDDMVLFMRIELLEICRTCSTFRDMTASPHQKLRGSSWFLILLWQLLPANRPNLAIIQVIDYDVRNVCAKAFGGGLVKRISLEYTRVWRVGDDTFIKSVSDEVSAEVFGRGETATAYLFFARYVLSS